MLKFLLARACWAFVAFALVHRYVKEPPSSIWEYIVAMALFLGVLHMTFRPRRKARVSSVDWKAILLSPLYASYKNMLWKDRTVQILESIQTIGSTKNIYILIDRYVLLMLGYKHQTAIYLSFLRINGKMTQRVALQRAKIEYAQRFPDRPLSSTQLALVSQASIQAMQEYVANSLLNCVRSVVEQQENEISRLKQNTAISLRRARIRNICTMAIDFFRDNNLPDDGRIEEIEQLSGLY